MEFDSDCVYRLSEEESSELVKLASLINPDRIEDFATTDYLSYLDSYRFDLSKNIKSFLFKFRREGNRNGCILLKNVPVGNLPRTPVDGEPSKEKTDLTSETVNMLLLLFLGDPICYIDEKNGSIIQNICPVEGHELAQENTSSESFLEFHTEDGFHPHKPDYLSLLCLRQDHEKKAETITSSINNVYYDLPQKVIELLKTPSFRINLSSSFLKNSTNIETKPIPVLSGNIFKPQLCVDFAEMTTQEESSLWALDFLKKKMIEKMIPVKLEKGDLLVIDNRVCAHARKPFKARYDGQDRWLQRTFLTADLNRSAEWRSPNSLVLSPIRLAANQGTI